MIDTSPEALAKLREYAGRFLHTSELAAKTLALIDALEDARADWADREADTMRLTVALEDAEHAAYSARHSLAVVMSNNAVNLAQLETTKGALREARRFMDYFANERTTFDGPGTPKTCLAQIDAALEGKAAP